MEELKTRPDIIELFETVAKENGIENPAITDVETTEKGQGYSGTIFFVTLKDKNSKKSINLVIKAAVTDLNLRKFFPSHHTYENEAFFYSTVYPTFKKLERGHISEKVEFVPKCYKVLMEEPNEMLCFENLKSSKFETLETKVIFDHEHIRLIFERYGQFHAYSFALRDQKPEEFQKIAKSCHNIMKLFLGDPTGQFKEYMKNIGLSMQKYLVPGEDDDIIQKFKKYQGDALMGHYEAMITEESEYPVILHGDCWSNNMMFKFEEKLTDMRLIDWQVIRAGSPVCDLSYALYAGSSKEVFDKLDEYLEIYHNSFSQFLKELGSDPEKMFPFEALKSQWKKYSLFGMYQAFAILRNKYTEKENILDPKDVDTTVMENMAEVMAQVKFDEESYGKRIRELLRHLCEIDVL